LLQKIEGKENNAVKNNLGLIYGNGRRTFDGNGLNKPGSLQTDPMKTHIHKDPQKK